MWKAKPSVTSSFLKTVIRVLGEVVEPTDILDMGISRTLKPFIY